MKYLRPVALGLCLLILTACGKSIEAPENPQIHAQSPSAGQTVESPLVVTGEARGNWYFEADFPIELLDGNGKQLTTAIASARGDWMTEDFVPFMAKLSWDAADTETGTLVLHKDNPSGLPENDDELKIPVNFKKKL